MSDEFIVAALIDGTADTETIHLPGTGFVRDEAPYKTKAVCGMTGVVYVRDNDLFGTARVCDRCAAGTVCGRYATVDRYNNGCRCIDCRRVMSDYRREYRLKPSPASTCVCGGRKARHADRCRACYRLVTAVCGTNSKYARGCRCPECVGAHSSYMRGYRARRAA